VDAQAEDVKVVQPNFGIRIKSLRRDNNLSQRALADLVGCTEEFINKVERSRSFVSKTTLERLAKAFKVSIASLLDFSGNKAFVNSGGLHWRASRTRPTLIVRHKRVDVRISRK
jgi:transcriptional regulator with XRE-family HTH domain